jgi:hypothetical protein
MQRTGEHRLYGIKTLAGFGAGSGRTPREAICSFCASGRQSGFSTSNTNKQDVLTSRQTHSLVSLQQIHQKDSKAETTEAAMDFVNRFTGQQFRPETLLKLTDL